MARKRRRFGSSFKAKVALESVRETRTISELAKKHKPHATQINLRQDIFSDRPADPWPLRRSVRRILTFHKSSTVGE